MTVSGRGKHRSVVLDKALIVTHLVLESLVSLLLSLLVSDHFLQFTVTACRTQNEKSKYSIICISVTE